MRTSSRPYLPRRSWVGGRSGLIVLALLVSLALDARQPGGLGAAAEPAGRRTLIRHAALVVTMDPRLGQGSLGTLADADVLIADDTIVAVGPGLSAAAATTVIEATGKIVLPGFVDLHNHLVQSVMRGG